MYMLVKMHAGDGVIVVVEVVGAPKIENRSRKKSRQLDEIGRIRTVSFSSDSSCDFDA